MSKITVELITENGPVNYYFVDPAAAVAFANYSREHATVINHHGQAVHVSTATEAAPVAEAAVVEPVVEVTVDAEEVVEVVELDAEAPVKKSRKKKEE